MIHSWIIWMYNFFLNRVISLIYRAVNKSCVLRNIFFLLVLISSFQKTEAQVLIDSIYKKDFKVFIHDIVMEGNKKTKEQIIFRQLTFKKGDSISFSQLQSVLNESKQYIINTGLFYNVTLNIRNWEGSNMDILISLEERLYTYPIPTVDIFDRNFNAWYVEHNHDGKRLQYGIRFLQMNMRGRNESLRINAMFGFAQKFELSYTVPYINQKQKVGLQFKSSYTRSKFAAIETNDNHEQYYFAPDNFVRRTFLTQFDFTLKPGYQDKHIFSAGFLHSEIDDTITHQNPDFYLNGKVLQEYFAIGYTFIHDRRDIVGFPLHGSYFDIGVAAFGILPSDNTHLYSLQINHAKYFEVGKNLYFAIRNKLKFSSPVKQPYYTQKGFGYKLDYVSGYEYYVVDGQSFWLGKLVSRYRILKFNLPNNFQNNVVKASKFPFNVFLVGQLDAGYVKDDYYFKGNPLSNSLLVGGGPGIDVVMFYDVAFQLQYSFNLRGENGLFLHFSSFF